ncbi:MAG: hypothetical protein AAGF60_05725 [Pseudomonadota bacterium]
MTQGWHILRDGDTLTLAWHLPARFDVSAQGHLPGGRAERLAHQIRQDLWRALQNVRGFSPVVRLEREGDGWRVTAGGRVMGKVPPALCLRIGALLDDGPTRQRWLRKAGGLR